jgi:hypothetical protein
LIEQPVGEGEQGDDGDPVSTDEHARCVERAAVEDLGEEERRPELHSTRGD